MTKQQKINKLKLKCLFVGQQESLLSISENLLLEQRLALTSIVIVHLLMLTKDYTFMNELS